MWIMGVLFTMLIILEVSMIMYWMSNSLIIQLILLVVYIITNSIIIYLIGTMTMISYVLLLSIVSGLVVVLSFVMMSEPNAESSSTNESLFAPILMMMLMNLYISLDISSNWTKMMVNQFNYFSNFSSSHYLMMFVFMALVLLLMLFVVDMILMSYGGSLLPMK